MITLILIVIAILIIWKLVKHYNYWNDRGIKQRRQIYLLGDNASVFLRKESFFDMMLRLYGTFPEERYIGMYDTMLPALLIRDPEIIKQITVKEFDHFLNHRSLVPDGVDPLWSKNLVALKDMKWRNMRSTLSPSFTTSKMKIIFSLISDCAKIYLDYFLKQERSIDIELKDITTRFTNDVIATAAFGVKCDSINEKNNEFYLTGKKITGFTFQRVFRFVLYSIMPGVCKALKLKLFPEELSTFFVKLIKENIRIRETHEIIRPDMINLLLEARKGKRNDDLSDDVPDTGFATAQEFSVHTTTTNVKQELTDLDIAAQASVFFFAGFDSVATLMSFLCYELALQPHIQQKLQEEIDNTLKRCNNHLTYEALMKMKYMDMVVSETLRKWPPALATDRLCSKSFTIEPVNPNESTVTLNPGDVIFIPINGIHRDPQYYPNPDKFDPERFNADNKENIKPYTYMPFGLGPRNCIGSRFAIMETKTIICYMLSKFNFIVTEKTQIPIVLDKTSINLVGEKGMWVGLEKRNQFNCI